MVVHRHAGCLGVGAFVDLKPLGVVFTKAQPCLEPRNVPTRPTTAAMMPPMSIQIALSVGEPVKNLETSELNEFVAPIPMTMSTTPPMSRARETILFITVFQ